MRLFLISLLLPVTVFANSEPLNFVEGDKNINPIIFSKINEKNINNKEYEGLNWVYVAKCETIVDEKSSSSSSSANSSSSSNVSSSLSSNVNSSMSSNTNSILSSSDKSSLNSSSNTSNTKNDIFECSQNETTLFVRLIDDRIGKGRITIYATARDSAGGFKKDFPIKYDVNVLRQPTYSQQECLEWVTCRVYNGFYMGVDGTSVDNLNDNTTLRVQYSAYAENFKHLHFYGDVLQTTQQEQTKKDPNCTDKCKSEPTIAGNIGTFVPFNGWVGADANPSSLLFGPMMEFNTRKLDTSDEFAKSYYTGVRFGLSKVRYFAIGYGKAEGVPGHRVKFIGQLPLYNNKVLAGINLNVSADDESEEAGESPGDSINISLVTRVDFTKIFTSWSLD